MKVFVVTISKGQWSDHSDTLSAVFTDRAVAESYCEKIKSFYTENIPDEPPYPEEDYIDDDKLTEDQQEEFRKWLDKKNDAYDFNSAYVTEFLLDFPEPQYIQP